MIEQIQQVKRYGRIVWPYRWLAMIAALLGSTVGSVYVFTLPPTYEVSAKLFVDTRSMLRPLMRGLAVDNNNLSSSAELMKRTLLTRPNVEKVARESDLDLETKTEREFESLITGLINNIQVSGTSKNNIYSITYSNRNPNKAKTIVDELLNTFLESALGSSRTDNVVTQKFIDEQLQEYEKRLIEAEERLRDFKQRNVGMMPGEGRNYYTRMEQAQEQLKSARLAQSEAARRRDELNQQLKDTIDNSSNAEQAATAGVTTQYSERITALEKSLDELLLHYTPKHPDILASEKLLESLKERHEQELKEMANAPIASSGNSGYNEIRLALGEASAVAAGLQTRVKQYEERVAELEKLVDTLPEIEAELARLDRDYGLNKQQYLELLERRESARLSQEVDQKADNVKLKVIEPPRVPLSPSGPDRVRFLSLVFLGAFGFGAALAFLMSQLNPRFFTTEDLRDFAGLPIMGAIGLVSSRRQKTERRMEIAVFGTVLLGLFALYGGLTTLELSQIDVHGKVVGLLGGMK